MSQTLDAAATAVLASDAELASFCGLLKDLSSKAQEEAVAALVLVFRSQFQLGRLASFMVGNAVNECTAVEQLLVLDSLFKKGASACVRSMLTQGFLQDCLSPVLSEICIFDLMLDPARADVGQEQTAVDRLYRTVTTVVDALGKGGGRFPLDAAEALLLLKQSAVKKFGASAQQFPLCERFLFGCITSLVSSPYPLIVDKAPATNAHRSLIAVAKVLQATAGRVESITDSFQLVANGFVNNNIDRAVQFVKRLLPVPGAAAATSPRSGGSPGFSHTLNPAEMTANDWAVMERLAAAVESFPKGMSRDALTTFLAAPGGTALRTLSASIVKKEDVVLFVPCLFRLFRSQGLEEQLVTWAINEHVAAVPEADPSFFGVRGKRTIPLMLLDHFVDRDGAAFMRLCERDLMVKFLEDARMERFDVSVADPAASMAASRQVMGLAQSILDRFVVAGESMEASMLSCCHKIVNAVQMRLKGKEMLALASFIFGTLLSRSLQFPRRMGMVPTDPSPTHARALGSVRLVLTQLIEAFGVIGSGDLQTMALGKFVLLNVTRVLSFVDVAVLRRPQPGEPSKAPVSQKDLMDAQVVLHGIRNPGATKKNSPEPLKKSKSTSFVQPRENKEKSGSTIRGLFGKISPRGDPPPKEDDKKDRDRSPPPPARSPNPNKKSEMPPELAALAAASQANRGKAVPVAQAQAMLSPRATASAAAAAEEERPQPSKVAIPSGKPLPKAEPAATESPQKAEPKKAPPPQRAEPVAPPKPLPTKTEAKGEAKQEGKALPKPLPPPAAAAAAALDASSNDLSQSMTSLQMSIPEFGLGVEEFVLPVWKPGDLVCAQWEEDRCWYKARIDERLDEDRYRVTFVEYGNSSICDNSTQIVELPDDMQEKESEAILSDAFNAEALVQEMSGQFGAVPDTQELAEEIAAREVLSVVEVPVDETADKLMNEVDLLAALDFSLSRDTIPVTNLKPTKVDPKRDEEERKKREAAELKKKEAEDKKKKRDADAAEKKAREAEEKAKKEAEAAEKKMREAEEKAKKEAEERKKKEAAEAASAAKARESAASPVMQPKAKAAAAGESPKVRVVEEPASIGAFLTSIGLAESLPLFEERKLTWTSLKLAEEEDLFDFGIPKKIMQKVLDALRGIPTTAVGKGGGASVAEIDYEKMAVLPPLPAEPPPMGNKAEYKNYMRLRYEHQKRQAAIEKAVSPVTSPEPDRKLSRQSAESKKGLLLSKLTRSKSKESLAQGPISKKAPNATPAAAAEEPVVRLERYDMLLDEELPELPENPPPIANKAEYKQYMVLRYEYERRGLLEPLAGGAAATPLSPSLSSKSSSKNASVVESVAEETASLILVPTSVDDFDPDLPDDLDEEPKKGKKGDVVAGEPKPEPEALEVKPKGPENPKSPESEKKVAKPAEPEKKKKPKTPEPEKKASKTLEPKKRVAEPEKEKKPVEVKNELIKPAFRYKVNDEVEAKWFEDKQWYAATVTQLDLDSPGGPFALVVFDEFGNDQVCELAGLRFRQTERVFEVGDLCECRWVEDDVFYESRVLEAGAIQDNVYTYTVEFVAYGNQQKCTEDYLRPLPGETCRVCECRVRPGSRECSRCGFAVASTTAPKPDAEAAVDGGNAEKNSKDSHRLTRMFEGIDAEMEELESLTGGLVKADPPAKATTEPKGAAFVKPAESVLDKSRVFDDTDEIDVQQLKDEGVLAKSKVFDDTEEDDQPVAPQKGSDPQEEPAPERKNRSLTQMFDAMDAELGGGGAEEPVASEGSVSDATSVEVEKPVEVAVKPPEAAVKASEDKSLGALEKARKIQEKLAQQKRAEEEAKQAQKAAEEQARQERLRKREESKKAGAEAKAASVIEESATSGIDAKSRTSTSSSGVDVKSRTSTSSSGSKSRATEILERAKALTAKTKGLAEEQGGGSAVSPAATTTTTTVAAAAPSAATKKALPQQPDREHKRSSLILEQARAARAIALGGAVAGRGRGLPTPPPKNGPAQPPAPATASAAAPVPAGGGAGVPVARPPAAKTANVSPSVNAALEKARKARNRLSVAKSLPGAGRGEGGAKVADKPLPSPRAEEPAADAVADAEADAVLATKAMPVPPAKVPPATGSPANSPLPTSTKPRPPPKTETIVEAPEEAVAEEAPATVTCPSCSAAQVPGYTFCDECGTQAAAKVETPEQRTRKATVRAMLAQKAAAKLAAGGESPQRSPMASKKAMPKPPDATEQTETAEIE